MADRDITARRVIAGVDDRGKSAVVADGVTPNRVVTDAFTINQIWQTDSLPPHVVAGDSSAGEVSIAPPPAGFVYLVTSFHPDSEWDTAAYAESLTASGGAAHFEDEIPGLHQTDTVDIITVVTGELHAVLETGEVLLRPGDSFVQQGTRHAWSVRGDEPATVVALMMTARR